MWGYAWAFWIILTCWSISQVVHAGSLVVCMRKRALIERRHWIVIIISSALMVLPALALILTWADALDGDFARRTVFKAFTGRRWLLLFYAILPLVLLVSLVGRMPRYPAATICRVFAFFAAALAAISITFNYGTMF